LAHYVDSEPLVHRPDFSGKRISRFDCSGRFCAYGIQGRLACQSSISGPIDCVNGQRLQYRLELLQIQRVLQLRNEYF
jgi:hypothetical protein